MKFLKKIKDFFVNTFSAGYDHATRSLNSFLATGKFPGKSEKQQPELVEVEAVTLTEKQVETEIDSLTELKKETIEIVAKEKDIQVNK